MAKSVKNGPASLVSQAQNQEASLGSDAIIAEIAYYKAENRGFEPGHELSDWLAAEREFLQNQDESLKA